MKRLILFASVCCLFGLGSAQAQFTIQSKSYTLAPKKFGSDIKVRNFIHNTSLGTINPNWIIVYNNLDTADYDLNICDNNGCKSAAALHLNESYQFSDVPQNDSTSLDLDITQKRNTAKTPSIKIVIYDPHGSTKDTISYSIRNTANGIEEAKVQNASLKIYPNPASSVLNFNYQSANSKIVRARIADISGRTVLDAAVSTQSINIDQLPVGMYQLQLVDRNGQAYNRVFIKR